MFLCRHIRVSNVFIILFCGVKNMTNDKAIFNIKELYEYLDETNRISRELGILWRSKFGDEHEVVKNMEGQTQAYSHIQWLISDWYELDKLHRKE